MNVHLGALPVADFRHGQHDVMTIDNPRTKAAVARHCTVDGALPQEGTIQRVRGVSRQTSDHIKRAVHRGKVNHEKSDSKKGRGTECRKKAQQNHSKGQAIQIT